MGEANQYVGTIKSSVTRRMIWVLNEYNQNIKPKVQISKGHFFQKK